MQPKTEESDRRTLSSKQERREGATVVEEVTVMTTGVNATRRITGCQAPVQRGPSSTHRVRAQGKSAIALVLYEHADLRHVAVVD